MADVNFTNPAAGATISAGNLNVEWKESGIAPLISDLATFQLYLMSGGNDADVMVSSTPSSAKSGTMFGASPPYDGYTVTDAS